MKRRILGILVTIIVVSLILGGCTGGEEPAQNGESTSQAEVINLDILHFMAPAAHNIHRMFEFIDYANARSNGRLHLNFVGGAEVIASAENAEAVINGVVDMSFVPSTYYQGMIPETMLLHLSEPDYHGLHRNKEEREPGNVYDFVRAAHEKHGLYFLGRSSLYASGYLLTNKEVKTLADLSQLKVAAEPPAFQNFIKALGGSVTAIPTIETYTALERGVVDSNATVISVALSNKLYEVVDYVITPPFKTQTNLAVIVNLDVWNSLPKDLQDLLNDDCIEQENKMGVYWLGLDMYSLQTMQYNGVEIIELPPNDAEKFKSIYNEEAWKAIEDKVSPEMYQQMRELAKASS